MRFDTLTSEPTDPCGRWCAAACAIESPTDTRVLLVGGAAIHRPLDDVWLGALRSRDNSDSNLYMDWQRLPTMPQFTRTSATLTALGNGSAVLCGG